MKKKQKHTLRFVTILKLVNVLLLFVILGIYGYRMVYFYQKENGKKETITYLVDEIIKKESYVDLTTGLVKEEKDNSYIYKGKVKNNYILFSNILYRIVSIDSDKSIKLIADNNLTLMITGLEKTFSDSYINSWLNNEGDKSFKNYLKDYQLYLNTSNTCMDEIENLDNITCQNLNQEYMISLLSLYDYEMAGGSDSYLNNNSTWSLLTTNGSSEYYYVTNKGDIAINSLSYKTIGIRPVITLNSETVLLSGIGTLTNPYIIESSLKPELLSETEIGKYVSYSNYMWKTVAFNDNSVKLVMDGYIKSDGEDYKLTFSTSNSEYSFAKNTLGYYLNNEFYNSLDNKEYLVKDKWYIGKMDFNRLDYSLIYEKSISNYVGLLNIGELYINEYSDTFTLTRSYDDDKLIYIVNESNNLYSDLITNSHRIRPAIYMNSKLLVTGGNGSIDDPYLLGSGSNEKEE